MELAFPHIRDKDGCFGNVLSDKAGLFLSPDVITVKFRSACFSPDWNNVFSNSIEIHTPKCLAYREKGFLLNPRNSEWGL